MVRKSISQTSPQQADLSFTQNNERNNIRTFLYLTQGKVVGSFAIISFLCSAHFAIACGIIDRTSTGTALIEVQLKARGVSIR